MKKKSIKAEEFDSKFDHGEDIIDYLDISKANKFPDGFKRALTMLGVKKTMGIYDYGEAKTIVLFCNGAWCGQSPSMIKKLMALGYPPEKIKWYRGGMHDWLTLSMTTTHVMEDE